MRSLPQPQHDWLRALRCFFSLLFQPASCRRRRHHRFSPAGSSDMHRHAFRLSSSKLLIPARWSARSLTRAILSVLHRPFSSYRVATGAWDCFVYQRCWRSRPVLYTFYWTSLPILWFGRVYNTRRCVVQNQHHSSPHIHFFRTLSGAVEGGWVGEERAKEKNSVPHETLTVTGSQEAPPESCHPYNGSPSGARTICARAKTSMPWDSAWRRLNSGPCSPHLDGDLQT